jgi:glycosyltransferase involved in cell wall biosynthesis
MRILNVTQSYDPFLEFGGPPVKVRALSEELSSHGHEVTVLTADWGLESRLSASADAKRATRSSFGWTREENHVKAIYLPTWLRYRALSWNPAVERFCHAQLKNFDVVHIFGLYDLLGPVVAHQCRTRKVPYVVEPMGMFVPIVRSFWLKRMYHSLWGRSMLLGARAIIATSEQEAAELASAGIAREKIVMRRNGVNVPSVLPARGNFRAGNGIPAESKLILFLGRLSSKKSPELLLQAFGMLSKDFRDRNNMRLVFAGPDERGMKAHLAREAQRKNLSSEVQFCGAIFGEEKWAAYRDADVFVLPSQNENFGNTAAEAIAASTPVIVTERCGIAPLLKNVAGLVVAHDAAAIAEALERVLTEQGLYSKLRAGCAEVTARLGWEEPARAMESLYAGLLESETRAA